MNNDSDFYDLWDDEDKPNNTEQVYLDNARLKAKLEKATSPNVERVYIVRGDQVYICHKGQIKMDKKKEGNQILRDIKIEGARMVMYDKNGFKKVDK